MFGTCVGRKNTVLFAWRKPIQWVWVREGERDGFVRLTRRGSLALGLPYPEIGGGMVQFGPNFWPAGPSSSILDSWAGLIQGNIKAYNYIYNFIYSCH